MNMESVAMRKEVGTGSMPSHLCRAALLINALLLPLGCSGGESSPITAPQNSGGPPGGGATGPVISVTRVTANIQSFRVASDDLIWTDGDPYVGMKKAPTTGGNETPLTILMNEPLSLHVLGQEVYWIENRSTSNAIDRLMVSTSVDGTVQYVAQGPNCISNATDEFVLDGENAYWIVCDTGRANALLQKVPLNGSLPSILATISGTVFALTADSTHIYWEQEERRPNPSDTTTSIVRISKTGGPPQVITTETSHDGVSLRAMVVREGQVFFDWSSSLSNRYRIRKVPSTGGTPITLADVTNIPFDQFVRSIAVDSSNVYWSDTTTINSVPIGGGSRVILSSSVNQANSIAIQGNRLFWVETDCCRTTQPGRIKSIPLQGGQASVILDGLPALNGTLAVTATNLYWIEGGVLFSGDGWGRVRKASISGGAVVTVVSGLITSRPPFVVVGQFIYIGDTRSIKKLPLDGGFPEILYPVEIDLATVGRINDITSDGSFIYWTEDGNSAVRRMSVSGGPVTTLSTGTSPRAGRIAVANGFVYWLDDLSTSGYSLRKLPVAGGTLRTIATNIQSPTGLEVDADNAYFAEHDTGDIRKVSVNGGPVTTLHDGTPRDSPCQITQDQTHIYWTNQTQVARVAKTGGGFTFYELVVKNSGQGIAVNDLSVFFVRDDVVWQASPK
jgi:hypothetical protein